MVTVVIPVYKNKPEFLNNLKQNMQFLNGSEIIVINDDPSESLKPDVESMAGVVLIENEKNMGFGQTVNIGINKAKNDFILLLNSDVILNDVNYTNSIERFKKNSVLFAVSFAQKERDGSIVGKNRIYWENGFFQHAKSSDLLPGKNGWAEGGTCIIDKNKFLKLGGFDPIFSPFYWEDVDLSYRAWKSGYEIEFDPSVQMIHHHESTIGKYFSKNFVQTIALRNQMIFIWKNIDDKSLQAEHRTVLIKMMISAILKGEFWKLNAFIQAFTKMSDINNKRNVQKELYKKTDAEILSFFK